MDSSHESAIIDKQNKLNDKIDNANNGIANILQVLNEAAVHSENNDPEVIEHVSELIAQVSQDNVPCASGINSKPVHYNISSDQLKILCSQVTEIFNDLSLFRSELKSINDELINLKKKQEEDMKNLKDKFEKDLNAATSLFKKEINTLNIKTNSTDQYTRINNLLFHNLFIQMFGKYDKTEFAHKVAELLNYFLPMLKTPVSIHNIDIAHPMRKNAKGQPIVIVRFTNRHVRHDIYDNKDFLKNHGVLVTEHLTSENVKLLNEAQRLVGRDNAWSYEGKLFAISNNKTFLLKSADDLLNLTSRINNGSNLRQERGYSRSYTPNRRFLNNTGRSYRSYSQAVSHM